MDLGKVRIESDIRLVLPHMLPLGCCTTRACCFAWLRHVALRGLGLLPQLLRQMLPPMLLQMLPRRYHHTPTFPKNNISPNYSFPPIFFLVFFFSRVQPVVTKKNKIRGGIESKKYVAMSPSPPPGWRRTFWWRRAFWYWHMIVDNLRHPTLITPWDFDGILRFWRSADSNLTPHWPLHFNEKNWYKENSTRNEIWYFATNLSNLFFLI